MRIFLIIGVVFGCLVIAMNHKAIADLFAKEAKEAISENTISPKQYVQSQMDTLQTRLDEELPVVERTLAKHLEASLRRMDETQSDVTRAVLREEIKVTLKRNMALPDYARECKEALIRLESLSRRLQQDEAMPEGLRQEYEGTLAFVDGLMKGEVLDQIELRHVEEGELEARVGAVIAERRRQADLEQSRREEEKRSAAQKRREELERQAKMPDAVSRQLNESCERLRERIDTELPREQEKQSASRSVVTKQLLGDTAQSAAAAATLREELGTIQQDLTAIPAYVSQCSDALLIAESILRQLSSLPEANEVPLEIRDAATRAQNEITDLLGPSLHESIVRHRPDRDSAMRAVEGRLERFSTVIADFPEKFDAGLALVGEYSNGKERAEQAEAGFFLFGKHEHIIGEAPTRLQAYQAAAEAGFAPAQSGLGILLANGWGISRNDQDAVFLFRQAAEQGDARGERCLGSMYAVGRGVGRNTTEALIWFRRSAERGDMIGQFCLGMIFYNGAGVAKDYGAAFKYVRNSAEQGYHAAQNSLGSMYDKGLGARKDSREAVNWYRKSAEQGYPVAMSSLGRMYNNGTGVDKNFSEAMRWYRLAAEQGFADAQNNVGVMYYNGEGVNKNYSEALKWFRLAVAQGESNAQSNLGVMYGKGLGGVSKNIEEAIRLYRLSAENGSRLGQYNLGVSYENGRGVPRDSNEAKKWYRLSAEQGYEDAIKKLNFR